MTEYPPQNLFQVDPALANRLAAAKEAIWFRIGVMQSSMNDRERALEAFERVLAVNPGNVRAMTQAGAVLAKKECYPQAVSYLTRAIVADSACGEAWAVLAHCYVMTDDLQKAYQAYQSALSHLPNPRDPNLWYGIGLLYDRYGSLDNALEAFLAVLSISPDFERADEVCFCIGIIYKEQQNFDEALKYFNKVVVAANPPPPLTRADGWYQIGHVNELKRDIPAALEMYKQALAENPKHPKTLQNYGWLEHQQNSNSTEAIRLLKLSAELDPSDGQTWYLLGRVYMALREFRQAYDAYQQAVYRDGRNATFWCSIGVLYYQMNQYRDAMDAYSRAIRLNPYVSEVWYDLGTLYESCGQNADAIDAYRRAAELAPENTQITQRLGVLESSMNPNAHPQQQSSQPMQSAAQSIAHSQPQQMQPDMHHTNQPHLGSQVNPVSLSRPIAPPLQQLSQPLSQQKLPHYQSGPPPSQLQPPPQQVAHPSSMGQSGHPPPSAPLSIPPRNNQMEMSPIPALRPPGISQSQSMSQSGSVPQDGRPALPSTLSSVQLPSPHNAGMNHLSPVMSQPLPSQPQSSVLPPPSIGMSHSQMQQQRSGSMMESQLQPLAQHHMDQDQPQRLHQSVPQSEGQPQSQLQQPQIAQLSPHSQQQSGIHQSQPQGQQGDGQHIQQSSQEAQQRSPHMQSHDTQMQQPSHQSPRSQPHPTSQMHPQHQNPLPQMQLLPHLRALPQIQQGDMQKKSGMQAMGGPIDMQSRRSQGESESDRPSHIQSDHRGSDFDRQDERHELPRIASVEKNEHRNESSVPPVSQSQPVFSSGPMQSHPLPAQVEQIPALKGAGLEASSTGTGGPTPVRSMSMHEITQSDTAGQGSRMEESQRDHRDLSDQQQSKHGLEKGQLGDRLPGLNSISGPLNLNSQNRDTREDAKLLTSVASASLPMASTSQQDLITGSDPHKPISSPSIPGQGSSGTSSGGMPKTPSLPLPTISPRNQNSMGGMGSKDLPGSNPSPNTGLKVSSLTKFGTGIGRAPVTPVSSSGIPSSLPSPLPARKGPSGISAPSSARSPRLSKPISNSSFKSVPAPGLNSSQGGQIESVPSPGSLPVLPALSSRPSNSEANKSSSKEKDEDLEGHGVEGGSVMDTSGADPDTSRDEKKKESHGDRHRKPEDVGGNKPPSFSVLRSAPAPISVMDDRSSREDDRMGSRPGMKQDVEIMTPSAKRDSMQKEDSGRTAKRPRLHDENDNNGKSYGGFSPEDMKKQQGDSVEGDRKTDDSSKSGLQGSSKLDIPSYKELKADMRPPNLSPHGESERSHKRDGSMRSAEGDLGKNVSVPAQVIDLPRLSAPNSKLPGSLPPAKIPTFRNERMNLNASRSVGGSGPGGKPAGQDASRGSLPLRLRSAPVTAMHGGGLKPHTPTGRNSTDRQDYGGSQSMEDSTLKRIGDDKQDVASLGRRNSREDSGLDRVTNGEGQKGTAGTGGDLESRGGTDVNSKEDKQSGRPEIHSSAT